MKLLLIAAVACATPAVAFAQGAPAAQTAAKFTLDTPIETIAADEKGKAVLNADFPGMLTHEAYDMFKSMSLRAVQPLSQGAISEDQLKKAETDLAAIK
jgi:hypothetical protein